VACDGIADSALPCYLTSTPWARVEASRLPVAHIVSHPTPRARPLLARRPGCLPLSSHIYHPHLMVPLLRSTELSFEHADVDVLSPGMCEVRHFRSVPPLRIVYLSNPGLVRNLVPGGTTLSSFLCLIAFYDGFPDANSTDAMIHDMFPEQTSFFFCRPPHDLIATLHLSRFRPI